MEQLAGLKSRAKRFSCPMMDSILGSNYPLSVLSSPQYPAFCEQYVDTPVQKLLLRAINVCGCLDDCCCHRS